MKTEAELLADLAGGSADALGSLWKKHHSRAERLAIRSGCPQSEADDAVSEAFRRVWIAVDRGHGPTRSFGAYLNSAVKSVVAERPRRYIPIPIAPEQCCDLPDQVDRDAASDRHITEAFRQLSARQQHAIWLAEVEGYPTREVGSRLGIRSNAASALIMRSRQRLTELYAANLLGEICDPVVRDELSAGRRGSKPTALAEAHLLACTTCSTVRDRLDLLDDRGSVRALVALPMLASLHRGLGGSARTPWLRSPLRLVGTAATVVAAGVGFWAAPDNDRNDLVGGIAIVANVPDNPALTVAGSAEPVFSADADKESSLAAPTSRPEAGESLADSPAAARLQGPRWPQGETASPVLSFDPPPAATTPQARPAGDESASPSSSSPSSSSAAASGLGAADGSLVAGTSSTAATDPSTTTTLSTTTLSTTTVATTTSIPTPPDTVVSVPVEALPAVHSSLIGDTITVTLTPYRSGSVRLTFSRPVAFNDSGLSCSGSSCDVRGLQAGVATVVVVHLDTLDRPSDVVIVDAI